MQFVDIRSDTVTVPTLKMREAMRDAKVGDDVYGEDPTISQLIQKAAKMFGKEAGIFVPSGLMANQLAILSWTAPGDEIILYDKCHITAMENGAIGALAGVQARTIDSETGILTPEEVEPYIRKQKGLLYPKTALICVQNSLGNGRIYPLQTLKNLKLLSEKYCVKVHTDGARIFNAAIASGVKVEQLAQYTDSVCFCLSKGLCCPYGSILLGPKDFIQKANYNKKSIGGGIRQGGFLAAAGIVALQEMVPHLEQDHRIAKMLAQRLSEIKGIEIDLSLIVTNILFFTISQSVRDVEKLPQYLLSKNIKFNPAISDRKFRMITHHYIRQKEVEHIVKEFRSFIEANS